MAALHDAIYDVAEENRPATVRQVYYRLVAAGAVAKTESAYKSVGRLLVQMRLRGELPWHWIADNTRWMRKPDTWGSAEDAIRATARLYRREMWRDLPAYVEVWCEKDALAGVLYAVTSEWTVPLMVTRGYSSLSYLHEAAETIKEIDKPAHLYYLGDHDPSGVDIPRQVERRLREFASDAEIHFERIACSATTTSAR